MERKVYVTVTTRLVLRISEGTEVKKVLDEMGYEFTSPDAIIEDTELVDYNITDSK